MTFYQFHQVYVYADGNSDKVLSGFHIHALDIPPTVLCGERRHQYDGMLV